MAIDAGTYFRGLRNYLNTNYYEVTKRNNDKLVLEERVFLPSGGERQEKVELGYRGEIVAFQLDKKNRNNKSQPLFHFFDDAAKPWSKRCDYVVFQLWKRKIRIYCLEFKSGSIPDAVSSQLKSSEAWCKAVNAVIKAYTGESKHMELKKFVFSSKEDPSALLNEEGYLNRDHTVKHYHYNDLKGLNIEELDNECPIIIR